MTIWLILIILIAVNAFYVAAEFAAVGLRQSRIKQLADEGSVLAAKLLPFLEDRHKLDRYIAACQIGITWSSLVLGAYGQATLGSSLAPLLTSVAGFELENALSISALVILVLLTAFQMVLGELVPKSLALHNPIRAGLWTVIPMRWSLKAYSWFIDLLNGSGWLLLKLVGKSSNGHRHIHSPDEIHLLLTKSKASGALEQDELKRLQGALRLSRRPVRQLMTPRMKMRALRLGTSSEDLLQEVSRTAYSRLPIFRGSTDKIEGILYAKDLLKIYLQTLDVPPIQEVMRPVLFVPESMAADKLFVFLREHGAHMVMVVDEFGGVVGLVTLDDLLSEVLGDMPDEFKGWDFVPERLPDGRLRLSGLMRLDEAEEWVGVPWRGDADTVGGYVMEILGRIPNSGETLTIGNAEVEVESVEQNLLVSILVKTSAQEDFDG